MKNIEPYLSFRGNCREVMTFYKKCLGGEISFMTFEGTPVEYKDEDKDKIIHSSLLINENTVLMAADCGVIDEGSQNENSGGNHTSGNIALLIGCENESETKQLFEALAEGGVITMPLQATFWSPLFGMLQDKYGVKWMFCCEHEGGCGDKTSGCGEKTSTKPENE